MYNKRRFSSLPLFLSSSLPLILSSSSPIPLLLLLLTSLSSPLLSSPLLSSPLLSSRVPPHISSSLPLLLLSSSPIVLSSSSPPPLFLSFSPPPLLLSPPLPSCSMWAVMGRLRLTSRRTDVVSVEEIIPAAGSSKETSRAAQRNQVCFSVQAPPPSETAFEGR